MKKKFSLITVLTVIFVSLLLGFFVNALVAKAPAKNNSAATYISYTDAKQMAQNYNIYRRQNMLNAYVKQACAHIPNGSTEETKSVWFTFNDLQGFLNDMVAANKGVPTANLGIRIYFGVYNDADAITLDNPYPNRMTMFFVPTVKTITGGLAVEADQVNSSGNLLLPQPVLNHGKICPPDTCGGAKF